jgi:acetyl/propionyl-CoA carboxylase alpha subunit
MFLQAPIDNRAEIACRATPSASKLGIPALAACSNADREVRYGTQAEERSAVTLRLRKRT